MAHVSLPLHLTVLSAIRPIAAALLRPHRQTRAWPAHRNECRMYAQVMAGIQQQQQEQQQAQQAQAAAKK